MNRLGKRTFEIFQRRFDSVVDNNRIVPGLSSYRNGNSSRAAGANELLLWKSIKRNLGKIPEEYRKKYATIPWRELAGFRDILIHQYEGVSVAEVWLIVEKDLNSIRESIRSMLPPLKELEKQIAGDVDTKA